MDGMCREAILRSIYNMYNVMHGMNRGGRKRKKGMGRQTERSLKSQFLNVMNFMMKQSKKSLGDRYNGYE